MFRTFQEEGIDLTMIDLEAYYTQLEVDALLDKIVIEKIKDDKLTKLKEEILYELKKIIVMPDIPDWEEVDTSDFVPNNNNNNNNIYDIKNYDKDNYSYQVFVQNNENNSTGGYGAMLTTHPKFPFSIKVPIETEDGLYFYVSFSQGRVISYKNKQGTPAKIQALYIQRKKVS